MCRTTRDDDPGAFAGSAYLFDATTGTQLFKLRADEPAAFDQFGFSVSISGNVAIVGAQGDDDWSGSAYLFDATTGTELFKLTAHDAAALDIFGHSVSISGNTAIIGAPDDDDAGADAGSAYLFDATTGTELFKLTAHDAAAGDSFGFSVSISGNIGIVGAYSDSDAGVDTGSAYLFDATTGTELFKLTAHDGASNDEFGWSVSISGNTAIVGAPDDDDAGSLSGSAYLFDATTGTQLFKLTADDAAAGDLFGLSVSISGHNAIVGAVSDDHAGTLSGSAYLFAPTYTLTLTIKNPQMGTVDVDPNLPEYAEGRQVTLTAEPNQGKQFKKWKIWGPNIPSDPNYQEVIDTNNPLYLTMNGHYAVKAFFKCGGGGIAPVLGIMLGMLGLVVWLKRRA